MSASQANTVSVTTSPLRFARSTTLAMQARKAWSVATDFVADVEVYEVIEGATLLGLSVSASVLMLAALGW